MGKGIPINTIRATQTTVNKLAIFFAKCSGHYNEVELELLSNKYERKGTWKEYLKKLFAICKLKCFPMEVVFSPEWKIFLDEQLKKINYYLIEFLVELKKVKDVNSAKSISNYLSFIQRAFSTF